LTAFSAHNRTDITYYI